MARIRTRSIRKREPTREEREEAQWWGGKFRLEFKAGGPTYWEVANLIGETADWHVRVLEQDKGTVHVPKPLDNAGLPGDSSPREYVFAVPSGATDCQILVGLQQAEGEIWVDDIAIIEVEPAR